MSTITIPIHESGIDREDILRHLDEVLLDRRFAAAERNAGFLRYVVERTLDGKADEIKESVIATEVYSRSGSYDPKADSIVRVEASRLRQKLKAYYENEGRSTDMRIQMQSGSYVPLFRRIEKEAVPAVPLPEEQPALEEEVPNRRAAVGLMALAMGATFALLLFLTLARHGVARKAGVHDVDATAAWKEAVTLLQQDPHSAETASGAPKTLIRAVERLEFAVARDPKLAPAWATLAETYDYLYPYAGRDPNEDARRAEAAARRAVALDPKLPAGQHMLGLVLGFIQWKLPEAEASYKQALALDPYDVYAYVEYADLLRETGRAAQAAELIRSGRALLPTLPQLAVKEAEIQLDLGHPDSAIAAAQSALEAKRDFLRAHVALGLAYESKGEPRQAIEHYEAVLKVDPDDRRALPAYGYALARAGEKARAREIVSRLEKLDANVRRCSFQIAVVYAGLGEQSKALDWLERAYQTRQPHVPFAAVETRFRSLHQEPRFIQLLARLGLKPVTLRSPQSPSA